MLDCSLSFCKISGSSQRDKIAAAAATDGTVVAAWVAIIMMLLLCVYFVLSNYYLWLCAERDADFIFSNDRRLKMFRGNNELEGGIF